ncbi:MAG: PD-(D/E)XK nuclease domain-containing protein, partial [Ignavibacteriaceae bacterium]|nr:PD-(D/E)XK nuclease domain-containing protein [Ignavibacteriaceae bacterium]
LAPIYIIKSEVEIKGEYPDLMYLFRKPNKVKFQFLIELKYLKKSESKKLPKTMEIATQQVNRYLDKTEISELENLKAYAVVFVGKKAHFSLVDRKSS